MSYIQSILLSQPLRSIILRMGVAIKLGLNITVNFTVQLKRIYEPDISFQCRAKIDFLTEYKYKYIQGQI